MIPKTTIEDTIMACELEKFLGLEDGFFMAYLCGENGMYRRLYDSSIKEIIEDTGCKKINIGTLHDLKRNYILVYFP